MVLVVSELLVLTVSCWKANITFCYTQPSLDGGSKLMHTTYM